MLRPLVQEYTQFWFIHSAKKLERIRSKKKKKTNPKTQTDKNDVTFEKTTLRSEKKKVYLFY